MPLTFTSYDAYLKSPHWRSLRAQRIILATGRCERCHKARRLEVHHTFYRPFWIDTQLGDLLALCPPCHAREHRRKPVRSTVKPPVVTASPAFATAHFQAIRSLIA